MIFPQHVLKALRDQYDSYSSCGEGVLGVVKYVVGMHWLVGS